MELEFSFFNTTLGNILLYGYEGKITQCQFTKMSHNYTINAKHKEYVLQIMAYLKGDLKSFSIEIEPNGTTFQISVWDALLQIPYGSVISYKELSNRLGSNANPRNVGQANGQNPIAIIIPCHRVIGQNMQLTGYAGGIEKKRQLLELEGALKQQLLF